MATPYRGIRKHVIVESPSRSLINERASERAEELGQPAVRQGDAGAARTLWVPIIVGDEAIGVISASRALDREQAASAEATSRLLSTLAANVDVAIQNARLVRGDAAAGPTRWQPWPRSAAEVSATLDARRSSTR